MNLLNTVALGQRDLARTRRHEQYSWGSAVDVNTGGNGMPTEVLLCVLRPSDHPRQVTDQMRADSAIVNLVCGQCATEAQRRPGILGAIVPNNPWPMIHIYDPPSARRLRNLEGNKMALEALVDLDWQPPQALHYWVVLDGTEPAELDVHCRVHGPGKIPSLIPTARRGKMLVAEYRASR